MNILIIEDEPGLQEKGIAKMEDNLETLRSKYDDVIFLSFPGDEKAMGGCTLFEHEEQVKEILNT